MAGIFSKIRSSLPKMFEIGGEDATFRPAGGTERACKVFPGYSSSEMPMGLDGQFLGQSMTIEVLLSDDDGIGVGTIPPAKDDEFVLDGMTLTVKRMINNDGLSCKLAVT